MTTGADRRASAERSEGAAAQEAGVTLSTLHRAERGRMPSVEHAVKIAEWLGQSLDALFRETR